MTRKQHSAKPVICIIDPDTGTQRSFASLLGGLEAEIRVFASAEDFLAAQGSTPPACLIAEVRLPGLSGLELFDTLKSAGKDVPTILVASRGEVASAVTALRAGAVDYFEKPIVDRTLYRTVAGIMRGHQSRRSGQPRTKAVSGHP